MDLGVMVEGFIEVDPVSGRAFLRIPQDGGGSRFLDIHETLIAQAGKEVRLIITPLDAIAALAKLVESGEVAV